MPVLSKECAITVGLTMNDTVDPQSRQPDSSASEIPAPAPVLEQHQKKSGGFSPWTIIAVLALGLAGWQWVETRIRLSETQQELAKRLAESDAVAQESRTLAKQAQEQREAEVRRRQEQNEAQRRLERKKAYLRQLEAENTGRRRFSVR